MAVTRAATRDDSVQKHGYPFTDARWGRSTGRGRAALRRYERSRLSRGRISAPFLAATMRSDEGVDGRTVARELLASRRAYGVRTLAGASAEMSGPFSHVRAGSGSRALTGLGVLSQHLVDIGGLSARRTSGLSGAV